MWIEIRPLHLLNDRGMCHECLLMVDIAALFHSLDNHLTIIKVKYSKSAKFCLRAKSNSDYFLQILCKGALDVQENAQGGNGEAGGEPCLLPGSLIFDDLPAENRE
jgi:hypothetical protein